ncbi:uncharacterized protein LOC141857179 [Brevipalpus obovatus]|uniref:uncharacterized protein LOC141857179 n=1 Tax=Brevipalpus obovatus TaxID=246614 RepID=UPI003D9DCF2A
MTMLMHEKGVELVPLPVSLSSQDSVEDVTPAISEQRIVMASIAARVQSQSTDLLNLIDWNLWAYGILLISLLLAIWRLLAAHSSLSNTVKTLGITFWSTTRLMLCQSFSQNQLGTSRVLVSGIVLLAFFLLSFLNGLVSTDLVIGEEPFTIDKLEDVLDPRASKYRPVWREFEGTYTIFSKSQDPVKRKIWQKAESIGLDQCFVNNDAVMVYNIASEYSTSPRVGFIYSTLAKFLKIHTCGSVSPIPWDTAHFGTEVVGSEIISIPFHMHNDSCKEHKEAQVNKWSGLILEANILNSGTVEAVIKDTFQIQDKLYEKWECIFGKDPYEPRNQDPIGTSNIPQLFTFLLFGLSLASIVLLAEVIWHRVHG